MVIIQKKEILEKVNIGIMDFQCRLNKKYMKAETTFP